jgi:hypothetical protein
MKADYSRLDFSILDAFATGPQSLDRILAVGAVRKAALQLARRRAGASPSESADETVKERLQALRRAGKIEFDRATHRWGRGSSCMSDFSVIKEGTWLYDRQILTGVRIVSCSMRWGTGDSEDPPEIRDDLKVAGFDVQWASPTSPEEYPSHASTCFATLEAAVEYAEGVAWTKGTLKWASQPKVSTAAT